MVPEAPLEETEAGLVVAGEGWFVVNARDARWRHREGRGDSLAFQGETHFPQVGIGIVVLGPGEPIAMYHWETDQEDFLVLAGEAALIIEGEEWPLRQWDFVHCPRRDEARDRRGRTSSLRCRRRGRARASHRPASRWRHGGAPDWGAYTVDEAAIRHGAGVEVETTDADVTYARFPELVPTRYRDGRLPSNLDAHPRGMESVPAAADACRDCESCPCSEQPTCDE